MKGRKIEGLEARTLRRERDVLQKRITCRRNLTYESVRNLSGRGDRWGGQVPTVKFLGLGCVLHSNEVGVKCSIGEGFKASSKVDFPALKFVL